MTVRLGRFYLHSRFIFCLPFQRFNSLVYQKCNFQTNPSPSSVLWSEVNKRIQNASEKKKNKKEREIPPKFNQTKISKVSELSSKRMISSKLRKKSRKYPVYSEKHVLSVLDALVTLGKLDSAWDIVLSCKQRQIKILPQTINSLLWACLEGDNKKKFETIWEFASDHKILSYESYASRIYFHSRYSEFGEIDVTLSQMKENSLSPEYLLKESKLSPEQARAVTEALRRTDPDLIHRSPPPLQTAVPTLLTSFYSQDRSETRASRPFETTLSLDQLRESLEEQLTTERRGYVDFPSVAPPPPEPHSQTIRELRLSKHGLLQKTIQNWRNELIDAIKQQQDRALRELDPPQMKTKGPGPVLPKETVFLCLLPPETWADIMIHQVALPILSLGVTGMSTFQLNNIIGQSSWHHYVIKKKDSTGLYTELSGMCQKYFRIFSDTSLARKHTPREFWEVLVAQQSSSLDIPYTVWPFHVIDTIGFNLLYLLVNSLSMPRIDMEPELKAGKPFYYLLLKGVMEPATIYPNEKLVRFYRTATKLKQTTVRIPAFDLPTLVPPKPWTSTRDGGLFLLPTSLVRVKEEGHREDSFSHGNKLTGVLDSLNALGNCAWRLNEPILDEVLKIFRSGGSDALSIPRVPGKLDKIPDWSPELDPPEFFKLMSSHRQERKANTEAYSLYMDALYRLCVADKLRGKAFWLPHYLDFRGRAYPMSPTLSHMGSDMQRGIMKFAVGKPLGPKGLDWLKIHLINLNGLHKTFSLQGRLGVANDLIGQIIESAENPMDGRGWWREQEEPWQVLSVCKEIRDAMASGDPDNFISHIPVHQDGSCNGLQHYAALGRDPIGAQSVNLKPSSLPADVYAEVAVHVERYRAEDAKQGSALAKKLEGLISRKVVKQPVMTEVYGVTFVGAREQVEVQLKELTEWPRKELFEASTYIVKLLNKSMNEMFQNAKRIQNWFAQGASIIARQSPVEWETPMGLVCVQPYHKPFIKRIKTKIQKSFSITYSSEVTNKPDSARQRSGFPPNFVHSLDSCHMMLTALNCQREGVTFVSIHDSYWTHAATVDTMGKILREQFIHLHSQPILENLSSHILTVFHKELSEKGISFFKDIPSKGNLDIHQITLSDYFFS